jgi:hypothetical protein
MSYEELGFSRKDQLEIRARAVHGAIHDTIGGIMPIANELESDEIHRQVEGEIAQIMEEQKVSEEEASLILAERILLERNQGE